VTGNQTGSIYRWMPFLLAVLATWFAAPTAEATHFRYGHITHVQRTDIGPRTVEFTIDTGWRRSFFGAPNVGSNVSVGVFNFGDGSSATVVATVNSLSVAEDWIITRATLVKTYASASVFTAFFQGAARISTLQNSADTAYRVETIVNLTLSNASPRTTLVPIVNMTRNAVNTLVLPATDANGDTLSYRLATFAESQITTQPGPPNGGSTSALTVSPAGTVTWNTSGTALSSLWACQIVIQESRGGGPTHGKVAVDFVIRIVAAGGEPVWDYPPTPTGTVMAVAGQAYSALLQASDPTPGDTLTIASGALPAGATLTPASPTGPSPLQATLNWTPSCAQLGAHALAFSVTDSTGQQALAFFAIDVVDGTPPDITCPGDITAECAGPNGAPVSYSASATDDCDPSPAVDCFPASGSLFPLGTTQVTCTATDAAGNSDQCSFDVTVTDTTPPDITCPGDITAECTGPMGAEVDFTVTATDVCDSSVTVDCTPASGSTFHFGSTQVCCTATDDHGNSSQCCFDVTVVDTTPPDITCPGNITAECTSPMGARVEFTVSATDLCDSSVMVECAPASGSTFPFGTTQVCCTATDDHGNRSTCCFDVTVVDTTPPDITCPGDVTAECTGPDGAVVEFTVTATDACDSDVTVDCTPASGSTFALGMTEVCCTATDDRGNSSQCCFDVTVVDTTPPDITCPGDVTAECTGPDGATVEFTVTATDACDSDVTVDCTPASGSTFAFGMTEVCCTATDDEGNSSQCCFTVTVADTTPPAIRCPEDVTAECTSPEGARVEFEVMASDLCDTEVDVDCEPPSGSTFPLGVTEVCCTATDDSGNSADCCFTVTVVDGQPPTIDCPGNITAECTGPDGAPVEFTVTATDDCDPDVTIECSPASGGTFPFGSTTVCCTATDDSGRSSQCCFDVTVVDTTAPVISCPADIRIAVSDVNAPVEFEATAGDLCDRDPLVQCDPPSGSVFPPGISVVACTATDDSGNTSFCDFEVTVLPCVNFDADVNGEMLDGTFISNQYLPLGVLVDGQSDLGPTGVMARRTGPPGSSTDDIFPSTGSYYAQTWSGGTDSDSGILTFAFVDPATGLEASSSYVALTFLDIERSGTGPGGFGRTRLQAFDKNGTLVGEVLVPYGPDGGQFKAEIGAIGGPLRITRAVATVGIAAPVAESGGVDELCFFLNPPTLSTRILGPGPSFPAGETAKFWVFVENNKDRTVDAQLILRGTVKKSKPGKTWYGPSRRIMGPYFSNFDSPESHTLRIPANKPAVWGRRVFFYADFVDTRSIQMISNCFTQITIMPPN